MAKTQFLLKGYDLTMEHIGSLHTLLLTAITIGTLHTLIGVDHYVPFIALSKSGGWTLRKTMLVVLLCGIGHTLSSVLLGFAGIALGAGVTSLVHIESIRGELAVWFLLGFGIVYTLWGLRNIYKNRPHKHIGADGEHFHHKHDSVGSLSEHSAPEKKTSKAIWGLFILFVLGPCEPLIPLLMYPAATKNTPALLAVTAAFTVCTVLTMMAATWVGLKGLHLLKIKSLEKYAAPLAGLSMTVCGVLMLTLGI